MNDFEAGVLLGLIIRMKERDSFDELKYEFEYLESVITKMMLREDEVK